MGASRLPSPTSRQYRILDGRILDSQIVDKQILDTEFLETRIPETQILATGILIKENVLTLIPQKFCYK